MFSKPFQEIALEDIDNLVTTRQEPESQFLEYKEEANGSDKFRHSLVKEVTGFANSDGGFLIIGVKEKDSRPVTLCGTDPKIGNQPLDEWINDVLVSNVDERLRYRINSFELKDGKLVVLLHVNPSTRKPHMATTDGKNTYFVRHNRSVQQATQSEVREMFQISRRSKDRFQDFLEEKKLVDEKNKYFGFNERYNNVFNNFSDRKTPWIMHSFVPSYLDEDRVDTSSVELNEWLESHQRGFLPMKNARVFQYACKEVLLDGLFFPEVLPHGESEPEKYYNYLELLNNGYIESVASAELFWPRQREGKNMPVMHLANAACLTFILLNFAKSYFERIGYYEEVFFQTSLIRVKDIALGGFIKKWLEPHDIMMDKVAYCKHHDNFKVIEKFQVAELTDEGIKDLVHSIIKKVCRAFGELNPKCFNDDGDLDIDGLRGLRSH